MKDLSLLDLNELEVIEPEPTPVSAKQLGILVLDGSGSMVKELNADKIPKGEAVSQAVRGLFKRFKISRSAESFCFSIVCYDEEADVVMDITEVKDLDCEKNYNPTIRRGRMTHIYKGILKAKEVADKFFGMPNPYEEERKVVIVILSDGVDMEEAKTKQIVSHIKKDRRIKVATCFFETLGASKDAMDGCGRYMEGLATNHTLYQSIATIEGMRKFFIASVSDTMFNLNDRKFIR